MSARSDSNSRTGSEFMGVGSLDCFYCAGGDFVIVEARAGDPLDAAYVVAGPERAADHFADVIYQHVVVFGAAVGVAHDALEDVEAVDDFYYKSGLFSYFAAEGVFEQLAGFEEAAGDGPPAFEGLAGAFDQERRSAVEDDGAHA